MNNPKHDTKIVDCPSCESKVAALVLHEMSTYDDWTDTGSKYSLLKCPGCGEPILCEADLQQEIGYGENGEPILEAAYGPIKRVWPESSKLLALQIPEATRRSIEEAQRCFDARAYNAVTVMCGRALETICREHTEGTNLSKGLKTLQEKGIIDGRLFDWGEELRKARNLGAHASDTDTNRSDARDLLEFTVAIGEYVYVLSDKYNKYLERKASKRKVIVVEKAKPEMKPDSTDIPF